MTCEYTLWKRWIPRVERGRNCSRKGGHGYAGKYCGQHAKIIQVRIVRSGSPESNPIRKQLGLPLIPEGGRS